jgi:hypothetical protein
LPLNEALAVQEMFVVHHQSEYEDCIRNAGVSSASIKSYISYLNSVSKYLNLDITKSRLGTTHDIKVLADSVLELGRVSEKTIQNYKAAMRQYVNMVESWS